jgi:hypothetical protein
MPRQTARKKTPTRDAASPAVDVAMDELTTFCRRGRQSLDQNPPPQTLQISNMPKQLDRMIFLLPQLTKGDAPFQDRRETRAARRPGKPNDSGSS